MSKLKAVTLMLLQLFCLTLAAFVVRPLDKVVRVLWSGVKGSVVAVKQAAKKPDRWASWGDTKAHYKSIIDEYKEAV